MPQCWCSQLPQYGIKISDGLRWLTHLDFFFSFLLVLPFFLFLVNLPVFTCCYILFPFTLSYATSNHSKVTFFLNIISPKLTLPNKVPVFHIIPICFLCCFEINHCNRGWPWTSDYPASEVLGLQECTATSICFLYQKIANHNTWCGSYLGHSLFLSLKWFLHFKLLIEK